MTTEQQYLNNNFKGSGDQGVGLILKQYVDSVGTYKAAGLFNKWLTDNNLRTNSMTGGDLAIKTNMGQVNSFSNDLNSNVWTALNKYDWNLNGSTLTYSLKTQPLTLMSNNQTGTTTEVITQPIKTLSTPGFVPDSNGSVSQAANISPWIIGAALLFFLRK